jgi:hypothetical protein
MNEHVFTDKRKMSPRLEISPVCVLDLDEATPSFSHREAFFPPEIFIVTTWIVVLSLSLQTVTSPSGFEGESLWSLGKVLLVRHISTSLLFLYLRFKMRVLSCT